MFDGRLQVYKREKSRAWQMAARVGGQRFRKSTDEESLERAKDVAEEWYLGLRGKLKEGRIVPAERTFGQAAKAYMDDVKLLTIGTRSPRYVESMDMRMRCHILPYFADKPLSAINRGLLQAYRVKRTEKALEKFGKPPARVTFQHEVVHIRQVLKFAEGNGWIPYVPNLAMPYLSQTKKGRRAWFSPEEYEKLYTATRDRIDNGTRPGWKSHYEDMHDFVLIMANTGLRPDEALRLEMRDVSIEEDQATNQTILVIDVRGKTGVGYCKSMKGAVYPFERLTERRKKTVAKQNPNASEEVLEDILARQKVFPQFDRDMFNTILKEEGLKYDRDGRPRTAYSLRHTYISMRLMEGANPYMIANNCRTSVQMIDEHYGAHIKNRLDAAALNVMRSEKVRDAEKEQEAKRAAKEQRGSQPPA
jgi:integrase